MADNLVIISQNVLFVANLERAIVVNQEGYAVTVALVGDDADMGRVDDDVATLPGCVVVSVGSQRGKMALEIGV